MGTGFQQLKVWTEAKRLAVTIYRVSSASPLARDYSLRDQMRRAAVSVPSNIAEGDERDTDKDSVRFFYMAKGSLAELRTQLEIAADVGLMASSDFTSLETECIAIGKMLGALIKARSTKI
ncbi:MAG: four helix bundle protein [Opitutaceae bacterium]